MLILSLPIKDVTKIYSQLTPITRTVKASIIDILRFDFWDSTQGLWRLATNTSVGIR